MGARGAFPLGALGENPLPGPSQLLEAAASLGCGPGHSGLRSLISFSLSDPLVSTLLMTLGPEDNPG